MKNLFQYVIAFMLLLTSFSGIAQIPVYNSYPSAAATVFLDFDGQYVDGTSWNMNGPITCGPSNLTTAQITEIFNRVSEDYRPFNINITTDSTVYWAAPIYQRMRVILTITSSWYGSAGGVSYIGSFTWGDNTPDFVFTALLNYNTKYIAEATSHEIGHTLGLRHQSSYNTSCTKTSEYNYGAGSGEIGWAPVMGCGYYKNFTLWHNGANPYGCTDYQDDLGIITGSANAFGYRTDDFSNNTDATATQETFVNNAFTVNGVIEKITDKDVFKVSIPSTGRFHLDATPFNTGTGDAGSNLDMQVELINSSSTVVGTYNPDSLLSASIDTTLNAGTYYLRVQGKGNIYAPDYASLGSYNLQGSFTPGTILPLHKLELHGINENNKHRLNWIIEADETVTQQILEASTDGRNFQQLVLVPATARSYNYIPAKDPLLYYRLNVTFDNGRQYYSNVVALRNNAEKVKPYLTGNLVQSNLLVNSPSAFRYTVYDYNGKMIAKGNVNQGMNSIATGFLSKSMYIIQFTNEQEQYTEKFMKQ